MIAPGMPAPDFSLPDQNGTVHHLEEVKGKWLVLYFYPKDNTPGCTQEACSFRDEWHRLQDKAVVWGVSTDSVASHDKFAQKYHLPFPILADADKTVVNLYGVWGPKKFMGREFLGTNRTTFLIDPRGMIQKVYPKVKPTGHAAEVLQDMNRLT